MFKKTFLPVFILLSVMLASCGEKSTPETAEPAATKTSIFTSTPNPCSTEKLPNEIKKINDLTRQFDDYAALASNTPQAQLIQIIPEMQRILRDAQDQTAPACLQDLKQLQLINMAVVVQTLMTIMSATDNASAEQINNGFTQARELHNQYDVERARLAGITLTPQPTRASDSAATDTNTASMITATNSSSTAINLRDMPDLDSPQAGILDARATTLVYGKTSNNEWVQVDIPDRPGQRAWVYAQLVSLSAPISQLQIINP